MDDLQMIAMSVIITNISLLVLAWHLEDKGSL